MSSHSTSLTKRRFSRPKLTSVKKLFRLDLPKLPFSILKYFKSGFLGVLVVVYLLGYQPTLAIPPIRQAEALANNHSQQDQNITSAAFSEPIRLPHPGYLTTKYSLWHPGVDIATGLGMPIRPILKGSVLEVSRSFWGLGNFVVVEHEQNIRSTYGHMGKIYVKKGEAVTEGSTLGEVGLSGWTSGPHTHLEITREGKSLDPQKLLPEIPKWEDYVKANSEVKPIGGI